MKTLKNLFKQEKEEFDIPKNIQEVLPVNKVWEDGIFLIGKNKYST